MDINLEEYTKNNNIKSKTNNFHDIPDKDYDIELRYFIQNRQMKNIEKLAFENKIKATETFYLNDFDEKFIKSFSNNPKDTKDKKISFALILAQLNLFQAFKYVVDNEETTKTLLKDEPPFIDIKRELKDSLRKLLKTNKSNLFQLSYDTSENYKKQTQFNVIKKITKDINEQNKILKNSYNINKEKLAFCFNNDAIFIVQTEKDFNYAFMDAAIKNDNLEMFEFLIQKNTTTNFSFIKIIDSIKDAYNIKTKGTKNYPKKIINFILDNYYIPLNQQIVNNNIQIKENEWLKTFYKGHIEIAIIKNQDVTTFEKILNRSQGFYRQNNLLSKINYKLATGRDFKSWITIYSLIKKHSLIEKEPLWDIFEKLPGINPNTNFLKALEYDNLYHNFIRACEKQEPEYQNQFNKLQFLIDNGIEIDQNKLNKRIEAFIESINIKKPHETNLEFIASVLNKYPSLVSEEQKINSFDLFKQIYEYNPNLNKIKNYIIISEKTLLSKKPEIKASKTKLL